MSFKHVPLEKIILSRIESDNGRKYLTPDGKQYESVTTWLSRITDKTWLEDWKKNIGTEEADKILKRAAKRGTLLHENVERYLKNETVKSLSVLDKLLFVPLTKVLDEHIDNIFALEYPLYSNIMKLAGTVDCVAEYDGTLSVIDFKTSRNRKDKSDIHSYFLQTCIYSLMIQELYGLKIDKLVILMAIDNENKVLIFEESRKNWITNLITNLKEYPPK